MKTARISFCFAMALAAILGSGRAQQAGGGIDPSLGEGGKQIEGDTVPLQPLPDMRKPAWAILEALLNRYERDTFGKYAHLGDKKLFYAAIYDENVVKKVEIGGSENKFHDTTKMMTLTTNPSDPVAVSSEIIDPATGMGILHELIHALETKNGFQRCSEFCVDLHCYTCERYGTRFIENLIAVMEGLHDMETFAKQGNEPKVREYWTRAQERCGAFNKAIRENTTRPPNPEEMKKWFGGSGLGIDFDAIKSAYLRGDAGELIKRVVANEPPAEAMLLVVPDEVLATECFDAEVVLPKGMADKAATYEWDVDAFGAATGEIPGPKRRIQAPVNSSSGKSETHEYSVKVKDSTGNLLCTVKADVLVKPVVVTGGLPAGWVGPETKPSQAWAFGRTAVFPNHDVGDEHAIAKFEVSLDGVGSGATFPMPDGHAQEEHKGTIPVGTVDGFEGNVYWSAHPWWGDEHAVHKGYDTGYRSYSANLVKGRALLSIKAFVRVMGWIGTTTAGAIIDDGPWVEAQTSAASAEIEGIIQSLRIVPEGGDWTKGSPAGSPSGASSSPIGTISPVGEQAPPAQEVAPPASGVAPPPGGGDGPREGQVIASVEGTSRRVQDLTASAARVAPEDRTYVFTNYNGQRVSQGAATAPVITISEPTELGFLCTYHWMNGAGARLGTLGLRDEKGTMYGPWQAVDDKELGAGPSVNWVAFVGVTLPPGKYTVVDSDPKTWSHNEQSGGKGFVRLGVGEGAIQKGAGASILLEAEDAVLDGGPMTYPDGNCSGEQGVGYFAGGSVTFEGVANGAGLWLTYGLNTVETEFRQVSLYVNDKCVCKVRLPGTKGWHPNERIDGLQGGEYLKRLRVDAPVGGKVSFKVDPDDSTANGEASICNLDCIEVIEPGSAGATTKSEGRAASGPVQLGGRWQAFYGQRKHADCEILQDGSNLEFVVVTLDPRKQFRTKGRIVDGTTVTAEGWSSSQAKVSEGGRRLEWQDGGYWVPQ